MTTLLGYGAHGKDIEAIWYRNRKTTLKLYDDAHPDLPSISEHSSTYFYIGVNNCSSRREIFRRLNTPKACAGAAPLIDKTVLVANTNNCYFGPGSVVAPDVTILTDVTIGAHTHVNYCSSMTRCQIGDFCTIAPGVIICGDVTIGNESFIGAGAVVKNLVNIGNGCIIGAGAVVVSDVPDGVTVMGVPAKQKED